MKLYPIIAATGDKVPRPVLLRTLRQSLGGLEVALCLHRVSETRRGSDWQPELNIPPSELDALLELLIASRRDASSRWLTVTFDDGYADAADYVQSRARRFPQVDWIFFVCPKKTEENVGFRWDLVELGKSSTLEMHERLDVQAENQREDLGALGTAKGFELASVEQCRRLATLPNVRLGNHTNCHFRQVTLSQEQAKAEYATSQSDFERLFGAQTDFAFPFGTPRYDFDATHVALLRAQGKSTLWSTERRPFLSKERGPGSVLPRFPVNGTWSHRQLALWVAARAMVFRARGTSSRF